MSQVKKENRYGGSTCTCWRVQTTLLFSDISCWEIIINQANLYVHQHHIVYDAGERVDLLDEHYYSHTDRQDRQRAHHAGKQSNAHQCGHTEIGTNSGVGSTGLPRNFQGRVVHSACTYRKCPSASFHTRDGPCQSWNGRQTGGHNAVMFSAPPHGLYINFSAFLWLLWPDSLHSLGSARSRQGKMCPTFFVLKDFKQLSIAQ